MAILTPSSEIKYKWLQKEVNLPKIISRGSKHKIVKPIQEWLCYHGFRTGVDQDFGPATQKLIKKFQETSQLPVTGNVDDSGGVTGNGGIGGSDTDEGINADGIYVDEDVTGTVDDSVVGRGAVTSHGSCAVDVLQSVGAVAVLDCGPDVNPTLSVIPPVVNVPVGSYEVGESPNAPPYCVLLFSSISK